MTLRTKLITASTLVTTGIFLVLAVVTLRYFENQQYDAIIEQQQATLHYTAAEVDATLQNAKDLLAANAKVVPLSSMDNHAAITAFLESRTGLHKLFNRHLLLLDPAGKLIAESHSLHASRSDFSAEPFFLQTVATRTPQVSDPLPCIQQDRDQHIFITAPVLDANGKLQAVMAGAFSLSPPNLLTRFGRVPIGKNSFIRLISPNYQVIVHTDPKLLLQPVNPGQRPLIERAFTGFSGTQTLPGRGGKTYITSVTRLKSINWVLAASHPVDELLKPVRTARSFFLVAIAASLLALVLVISGYLGYLTAPLKQFTHHLQQLPFKKGDQRCFPVSRNDEVGQMARTFNELITVLDGQNEELLAQNFSLEQEMLERQKLQEELQHEQQELAALNMNLTQRVTEEVAKNREKDHQLMQQERLVVMGELLSALSHQWRQPLNNVALLIQKMQMEYIEGVLTREGVDSFSADTLAMLTSLSHTLEEFRTFFQSDRELTSFNPVARTEVVVNLSRPTFESHGIQLEYQGEGDTQITGHCNEFTRTLMTILGNAREVLQARQIEHPHIYVQCTAADGHAVITIRDNGGGIPQEAIERIFDPYYTTKFMSQGTGLGLFMCKTVIERVMHGSLTVRNAESGAEFTINI